MIGRGGRWSGSKGGHARRLGRAIILATCAAGAGCRTQAAAHDARDLTIAPEPARPLPAPPPPEPNARAALTLLDTPVTAVARVLDKIMGTQMEIQWQAQPYATCMHVSIDLARGWTDEDAFAVLEAALDGSALVFENAGKRFLVRAHPNAPTYPSCRIADETWSRWLLEGIKRGDGRTIRVKRGLATFFRNVGAGPRFEDPPPGAAGLVLTIGRHASLYDALGLEDGDLITSIAGVPMTWSSEREVVRAVQNAPSFVVALVRDGRPLEITFAVVD